MKNPAFPSKIFVTGTDTDVGKTVAAAMLTAGLNAMYWKPVQSGAPHDTDTVKKLAEIGDEQRFPEAFRLTEPLSPHASAKIDGVHIDMNEICLPDVPEDRHLVVEGAGGLLVPLNDHDLIIDLIWKLELPVVLVTRSSLGTINHTLLSIEALRNEGIEIFGVIMNGEENQSNLEAIEHYGQVPVIGRIPRLSELNREALLEVFSTLDPERELPDESEGEGA